MSIVLLYGIAKQFYTYRLYSLDMLYYRVLSSSILIVNMFAVKFKHAAVQRSKTNVHFLFPQTVTERFYVPYMYKLIHELYILVATVPYGTTDEHFVKAPNRSSLLQPRCTSLNDLCALYAV